MTNEEKAREITKKNYSEMLTVNRQYIDFEDDCYDSALEMARWKDESAKFAFCKTICPKNCRLSFGQSCVMLDSFIKELKKGETN